MTAITAQSLVLSLLLAGCGGGGGASLDPQLETGSSASLKNRPIPSSTTLNGLWGSTRVTLPTAAPASSEYHPLVMVPGENGTSVLAWADRDSPDIRLAVLDANDRIISTLPSVAGREVHAGLATDDGVVLAVMDNDPDIYSPKYCQGASTPTKDICGKLDLVGLTDTGGPRFRTTLTSKVNVDSNGARFIWWYHHTARIAYDGNKYGVYFRNAGSYPRPNTPGEVDIHAGDALRFVSASGKLLTGGWEWGCSHSWSVRLAFSGAWGAACHGDAYPNAMRLKVLNATTLAQKSFNFLSNTDPTKRALGGMVPTTNGFWMSYIATNDKDVPSLHLAKFNNTTGAIELDRVITTGGIDTASYPFRVYLASYSGDKLLLGWKSGGKLLLAVADANTGELLIGANTTTLSIDDFQEFNTTKDGDVVWAHTNGGTTAYINRVSKLTGP